jgi:uncharacterized protein YndB with AHSA1/START domain
LALSIAVLSLVACSPVAPADAPSATAADATGIQTTSFTDAQGVRTIQLSVIVPAPQVEVFDAIATTEGWKTWAVPSAFGIIAAGNVIETSYDPAANPGDPGNITQEFLVVLPPRLVVMRTVKAPEGFPHAQLYYKTTTLMELAMTESSQTRLTLTHTGFGPGEGYDELHAFFEKGDAETLEQLRKRFESGPVDWTKR